VLRKSIIRLCLPIIWRTSERRIAQALQRFSVTEVDSAWQSLYAMKGTRDPKLRAKLFQHALEEMQHGALFGQMALSYSDTLPPIPLPERNPLYDPAKQDDGLLSFYAHEYVGESIICDEFDSYQAAAPRADIKNLFSHVKRDEIGHATYTSHALKELAKDPWTRRRAVLKARFKRLKEGWLRFSKSLGEFPPIFFIGAIYYVSGPLLWRRAQRRLTATPPLCEAGNIPTDASKHQVRAV